MKKITATACALAVVLAGCSSWFPQNPTVVPQTEACVSCVGAAVVANYTSATPEPFYPQLCISMLTECGSTCGTDLATVISAVAASVDPKVQSTPAYGEAVSRRAAMLAK